MPSCSQNILQVDKFGHSALYWFLSSPKNQWRMSAKLRNTQYNKKIHFFIFFFFFIVIKKYIFIVSRKIFPCHSFLLDHISRVSTRNVKVYDRLTEWWTHANSSSSHPLPWPLIDVSKYQHRLVFLDGSVLLADWRVVKRSFTQLH